MVVHVFGKPQIHVVLAGYADELVDVVGLRVLDAVLLLYVINV